MSDEDAPPVAPYTGRTSAPEPTTAPASPSPWIRWGRITALQLGAGFLVAFLVPAFLGQWRGEWIGLALISGLVIGLIGGGIPLLGARLGFFIATRGARGPGRELLGVVLGALAGAALLGLAFTAYVGVYGFVLVAVIGLGSAVGFTIWVLVAWGPHVQSRPVR
jgi:hypothetical protein